ncbi:MAG: hypothetical protein AAF125_09085, partial [Chloroflexota bacterium]
MTNEFERAADLKQRQIDLLMAIDTVRDQISDDDKPKVMYMRLLKLLLDQFHADAGAIVVLRTDAREIDST